MNNDLAAGFTRAIRRLIAGTVIDDEDVIELLARPADNVGDMFSSRDTPE